MLSPFGKFSRKLRLERGELLLDMAKKLQVQPSYLSSVEVGRKSVPKSWKKEIAEIYNLNTTEKKDLENSIDISVRQIKIDMEYRDDNDRELLLTFARRFDDLDFFAKQELYSILHKDI